PPSTRSWARWGKRGLAAMGWIVLSLRATTSVKNWQWQQDDAIPLILIHVSDRGVSLHWRRRTGDDRSNSRGSDQPCRNRDVRQFRRPRHGPGGHAWRP